MKSCLLALSASYNPAVDMQQHLRLRGWCKECTWHLVDSKTLHLRHLFLRSLFPSGMSHLLNSGSFCGIAWFSNSKSSTNGRMCRWSQDYLEWGETRGLDKTRCTGQHECDPDSFIQQVGAALGKILIASHAWCFLYFYFTLL